VSDFGAAVAIIEDKKVLLTQREDFEVWCLPGGSADRGEAAAMVAVREAREETGLHVALERLVGLYSRTGDLNGGHLALFAARMTGGNPQPQTGEVIDMGWFAPDALPADMFWWHRPMVEHAFHGATGAVWTMHVEPPEPVASRRELYTLRDRSGLSRVEFYRYYFEQPGNYMHPAVTHQP